MQSPRAEWTVLIGALALIDYLRARGEADSDTISECLREIVVSHRHGEAAFTAALAASAWWFHGHILSGIERRI